MDWTWVEVLHLCGITVNAIRISEFKLILFWLIISVTLSFNHCLIVVYIMNPSISISLGLCHLETKVQEANSSRLICLPKYRDLSLNNEVNDIIKWIFRLSCWLKGWECLPMQGAWSQSLVQVDPTCHEITKPVCYNYWAHALEPVLHNKKSHCKKKERKKRKATVRRISHTTTRQ